MNVNDANIGPLDWPAPAPIPRATPVPDDALPLGHPTVRDLRHRAEVPMLIACGFTTAAGIIVGTTALLKGQGVPYGAALAMAGAAVPMLAAAVVIRWTYWRQVANSVEVTDHQLGDLHTVYLQLVTAIGLDYVPRLYVTNGNGALNAWASKCQVRRGYVVVASDLVDVAYEHGDWATLRFVLAHELGHIRCGHVALWRVKGQ